MLDVVILAAGQGSRMKSDLPKVLHQVGGIPMIQHVINAVTDMADQIVVVVGHGQAEVRAALAGQTITFVEQTEQLGTGHALAQALPVLNPASTCLMLYGDGPLILRSDIDALVAAAAAGQYALLTADLPNPTGYGRILRDGGQPVAIVEEKDASVAQRAVTEVNTGLLCAPTASFADYLPKLSSSNAQGEYYITDLVGMADAGGRPVLPLVLEDAGEAQGVNDLGQLAEVRWQVQMRILEQHMAAGVRIMDPATTFIDHGVEIGCGTEILPCTVIRSGVKVGEGCEVGPFTHLRAGAVLEDTAEVGNFTEMKNSTLGSGSKAKHLSYLGDTRIGAKANIGAGTIFANYDGKKKHPTTVGDGAFIGSGSIVVAPNEVPPGATTGAGAVITRSAEMREGETWVGMPARKLYPKS